MNVNNSGIDASRTPSQTSLPPYAPNRKKPRRTLLIGLIILLILLLLGSGLIALNLLTHTTSTTQVNPIVGYAFFTSSKLETDFSAQGINDELQIDLHNISTPPQGKSYYAWLLSDKSSDSNKVLLIGPLTITHNAVHFSSKPLHSDLLQTYSRFIITEDNAGITPTNPSSDPKGWVYSGELAQTPDPTDTVNHYSLLDHLRFLLSQYPALEQVGVAGGLNMRFYINIGSVLQWAGSARDYWNSNGASAIHLQMIRILDYLDGISMVQADVPPGTPVIVDKRLPIIGLLPTSQSSEGQPPANYIDLLGSHITAITKAPGVTTDQRHLALEITAALNNVHGWLEKVRQDAKTLVFMSNQQLLQRSSLLILDDLQTQAFNAFAGQLDPLTNDVQEGVVQINFAIQRLATFDVATSPAS